MARRLLDKKKFAWIVTVNGSAGSQWGEFAHVHAELRTIYNGDSSGKLSLEQPWYFGFSLTSQYDNKYGVERGYAFRVQTVAKSGLGIKMVNSLSAKVDGFHNEDDFYEFLKSVSTQIGIPNVAIYDKVADTYNLVKIDSEEGAKFIRALIEQNLRQCLVV